MNTKRDNILVDSCQYTPVYLVENTGAIQGRSFIITQANVEEPKPVTDNLKRYYENSGILDTTPVNNVPTFSKPRILKRQETKLVGNNLKLANFLLPKNIQEISTSRQSVPISNVQASPVNNIQATPVNNVQVVNNLQATLVNNVQASPVNNIQTTPVNSIQTAPVNNVVYKPIIATSVMHTVPKVEVERKIVKLKNFPAKLKPVPRERVLPKIKPKDEPVSSPPNPSPVSPVSIPPNPTPIKHTSVQLLKLGETYHSLNQLSDSQMKMVNQALKIFSNSENESMAPMYDPVTNTRFIYKLVSPRDLTVVGKNKLRRVEFIKDGKKEEIIKEPKREPKKVKEEEQQEPPVTEAEKIKVTRSGRKVKFPKQIVKEIPAKPRKKNGAVVSCFQCSTEFCSLYRLQKHYETHPTHIPAKIHSNLFHCLMAITKSGSEEDRANIFIQQLEQLIEKLKSLLPCLLRKTDGVEEKPCTINDNVARLFGMNPGKYSLNMDALTCVKDKEGYCRHNPPPKRNFNLDSASPHSHAMHLEESTNESETEDCARVNAVDKLAIANKRFRKIKQQKTQEINAKRIKLTSEGTDTFIELDDIACNDNFSLPVELSAHTIKPETISLLENFTEEQNGSCIQPVVLTDTQISANDSGLPTVVAVNQSPSSNSGIINTKQQKTESSNVENLNLDPDDSETPIELDDFDICNSNFSLPMKHNTDDVQAEAISLLENYIGEESNDCIQQPVHPKNTLKSASVTDLPKKGKGTHTQFHSAHFDIRSSPIKTSSAATFRKFQINPERLAKYEVQIIRPLELDKDLEVHPNPKVDITDKSEKEAQNTEVVILEDSAISNNSDNSVLQSIFRDDLIELTCKDPNDIPNDLDFAAAKEWISSGLNSVGEKSDDFLKTSSLDESFIRGNSLIEPALLHCKEDSHDKLVSGNEMTAPDHLSGSDNHLLNQSSSSVLNFLDSLGSECLSYPETEIRNNNVDFQLDLFSFSNT